MLDIIKVLEIKKFISWPEFYHQEREASKAARAAQAAEMNRKLEEQKEAAEAAEAARQAAEKEKQNEVMQGNQWLIWNESLLWVTYFAH